MAESQSALAVTAEELSLTKVRVVVVIPGLEIERSILKGFTTKPKNAKVDVKFHEWSFNVTAEVEGKGKKKQKYESAIKQLPGEIEPGVCTIDYKKEQIILTLHKKEEESWAVQLSQSGLEQADDD